MAKNKLEVVQSQPETLPFIIHPRVFKALGTDLVTNDVVAIIELVKNAYDAYATAVEIRFIEDATGLVLEIEDNGSGMSRETIREAWCTVATPYRQQNAVAKSKGNPDRRTSGEKGLGRLSAARLGTKLEMVTQSAGEACWTLNVDWEQLASAGSLEQCVATIQRTDPSPLKTSGTLLRIAPLRTVWNEQTWDDLRDNLARLLPPFGEVGGFSIRITTPGEAGDEVNIEPPSFLRHPKYMIRGRVSNNGAVQYEYKYRAVNGDGHRTAKGSLSWGQVQGDCVLSHYPKRTFAR